MTDKTAASRTPGPQHYAFARGWIVTANADGSIPLNSKIASDGGEEAERLIAQANLVPDLVAVLREIAGVHDQFGKFASPAAMADIARAALKRATDNGV